MKKAFWPILLSLILAIGIAYYLPQYINQDNTIILNLKNETSLVSQEILSYSDKENSYTKIYASGKLIGIVNDMDYLNNLINEKYKELSGEGTIGDSVEDE